MKSNLENLRVKRQSTRNGVIHSVKAKTRMSTKMNP